jgi:hypothetical protein
MSNNSPHIEFEKLTDFVLGVGSETERTSLADHLRNCAVCSTKRFRLEKTIGVMQSDRLEEVPSHILERTFAQFADRRTEPARPMLIQRLTAFLTSETVMNVPAYGLRSGQSETARRLWFSAGEVDIDLHIRKSGDSWEVDGQVFGSFLGGSIELRSEHATAISELSDGGEFSLGPVAEGDYSLLLSVEESVIEVPSIRISE